MSIKKLDGLYRKFSVARTDGQHNPGQKHYGCSYFVLDLDHDPYAYAAIIAYARRCDEKHPALANDLYAKARAMATWMAERALEEMPAADREAFARMVHNDPERR